MMDLNSPVELCPGLTLRRRVYNASIPIASTLDGLSRIKHSNSGAILTKTCTLVPIVEDVKRKTYSYDESSKTSFNRYGLRNPGVDYFLGLDFPKDKPYILSFLPEKPDDVDILSRKNLSNIDSIELNISCPNHRPGSFDAWESVKRAKSLSVPVGIKVGLCTTQEEIMQNIREIPSSVKYVVCGNTLPNGIDPDGFCGAVGGKPLKPIALWNVSQYCEYLDIPVIGCGGVFTRKDVDEYLSAGAVAVQIGTAVYQYGPQYFDRFLEKRSMLSMSRL